MMQNDLRFITFFDLDMMDLKALGRFRQKTIKQRTRLKIQLTTYVDQVFLEIQYFFKSGLDPSVYQSGNFQAKTTRMSKQGTRVLHYALINAAWNVVRNNATFEAYYNVKMAEGRSHYNAL